MDPRPLILWFDQIRLKDTGLVGGKNAALGEMYSALTPLGVLVPNGFAVTVRGFERFVEHNELSRRMEETLRDLDTRDLKNLQSRGRAVREMFLSGEFPEDLRVAIHEAYHHLGLAYFDNPDVAVRSSATAEDLPGASFAGQQETYLNVRGPSDLLLAVKRCFASLFTDRAISYRVDKGFAGINIALSVSVQKMVRSDLASSGVAFTIDTETGFDKIVVINGVYGLGETIVQGQVTPDEFVVFKPTLAEGRRAIISKNLGLKTRQLVYAGKKTKLVVVPRARQTAYALTDDEILTLARWCVKIEEHFSGLHARYQPMDIEWAKDGESGQLFIVQARPETVQSERVKDVYEEYRLKERGRELANGIAVGAKIGSGVAHLIKTAQNIDNFRPGEILVTEMTDPDWEPIMKIAAGIVTDKGGRTSHAAIVSRELGIPCVVGTKNGTRIILSGKEVTVDCSSGERGIVYEGILSFEKLEHRLGEIPKLQTGVMVNIGAPDEAFKHHYLPVRGVGLGRLEFIIASHIKIHPRALLDYKTIKTESSPASRRLIKKIEALTAGYEDKTQFYIDELAEGVGKIATAFWPHPAIIRFSDFKTNEYRKLLGGERYELEEENPMLGWRGASRYAHPEFREAFALECRALKKAREEMGLQNIVPMIPFCRTPEEGRAVVEQMTQNGLDRAQDSTLKIYVMCEIPSNILLADEFLEIFDGMSIGSNDLTQLVLGLDRDSERVSGIANESNKAVLELVGEIIEKCRGPGKYIGICGQAPSDLPGFVEFLVEKGIQSISLNPDAVMKTVLHIAKLEQGKK